MYGGAGGKWAGGSGDAQSIGGGYQMFIVGKMKEEDSELKAGMSERGEYPELQPIGDVLASSDFSAMVLVLVISSMY